jgi:hypothetical protein
MSFYAPADSKFTRHYTQEVEMVLSAIDCLLEARSHREQVIYCSSELTTGWTLYEALRQRSLQSVAELKSDCGEHWYQENIFRHNCLEAVRFAQDVRGRFKDSTVVITPAPFYAPEWSQPEYLAFWETLLRTRITKIWLNRNWQYSNGCTFELAVALDAGLPVCDEEGRRLTRDLAVAMIAGAVEQLRGEGFDTSKLTQNLERMVAPLPSTV